VPRRTTRGGVQAAASDATSPAATLATSSSALKSPILTRATTRGGGQAAASAAIPTSDETMGKRRSKLADATAKKKAKSAADAALAADAATAAANATASADILDLATQRVFTRSTASVASHSSAATKNPGKNLYIFMFI